MLHCELFSNPTREQFFTQGCDICHPRGGEGEKGGVTGGCFSISVALVCCTYNFGAWCFFKMRMACALPRDRHTLVENKYFF